MEVGQQDVDVAWDFYPKAVREKGRNIEKECNTDKGDAGVKSRGAGCPGWGSECCQENQDRGGSNEGSIQQDSCKGLGKAVEDADGARRGPASWAWPWWTASGQQQPAGTGGGTWADGGSALPSRLLFPSRAARCTQQKGMGSHTCSFSVPGMPNSTKVAGIELVRLDGGMRCTP